MTSDLKLPNSKSFIKTSYTKITSDDQCPKKKQKKNKNRKEGKKREFKTERKLVNNNIVQKAKKNLH